MALSGIATRASYLWMPRVPIMNFVMRAMGPAWPSNDRELTTAFDLLFLYC